MKQTKLICITPVKNESWILDKFLTFTSEWADHIIIADQNSTDNSVEIASKYDNVKLIKNEGDYNEFERTKLLINEARKIEGRKIIFALDADEFLSANFKDSPEWETILNAPEKTIINLERINITPDYDEYFGELRMVFGLVDDGESSIEQTSKLIIHNIRLPWPKNAKQLFLNDIKCIHSSNVYHQLSVSKLMWYQCFEKEKLNRNDKNLNKKYAYFKTFSDLKNSVKIKPLPSKFLDGFIKRGLDFTSYGNPILWWDDELLKLFEEKGINKFKNLSIKHVDWVKLAQKKGIKNPEQFKIKTSLYKKILNRIKLMK